MKQFKTSDILLAASLRVHGYPMVNIEKQGTRGIFVFDDIPDEFIRDYDLNKVQVEPIAFNNFIKSLTTAVRRMV